MKAQVGEGLRVAVEEFRRFSADDAVERSDALLAVEQELYRALEELLVVAHADSLGVRDPHEQGAHRVAAVERGHEAAHLVTVPHVAALEFGQGPSTVVDEVEDCRDFHKVVLRTDPRYQSPGSGVPPLRIREVIAILLHDSQRATEGHRRVEERSLQLHGAVADKLRRDPEVRAKARERVRGWLSPLS